MNEQEQWYEWEQGRARCPMCIGLDMDEFDAVCDCSRYSLETTGKPLVIQVIGVPESRTVVLPDRIVGMRSQCQRCGHRIVGRVLEVEGEWLYRCPACDAYDWWPVPRRVPCANEPL